MDIFVIELCKSGCSILAIVFSFDYLFIKDFFFNKKDGFNCDYHVV